MDIPAPAKNTEPARQDIVEIHLEQPPAAVPASEILSDAFTGTSEISGHPPVLELAMAGVVLRIPQGADPALLEQVLFILKGLPCQATLQLRMKPISSAAIRIIREVLLFDKFYVKTDIHWSSDNTSRIIHICKTWAAVA